MSRSIDVLFVCLHGSAKSVIAAEHFRRLAAAKGVPLAVASAGLEPDEGIPLAVVSGLRADGIDVHNLRPVRLTDALLACSCRVVSFAGELDGWDAGPGLIRWDDVPAVSDGYAAARDAIVSRITVLSEDILGDSKPPAGGPLAERSQVNQT